MGHSELHLPAQHDESLMLAELERLKRPLGLLRGFSPPLEALFRQWLDKRMRHLLGQYFWALMLLFLLLVVVSLVNVLSVSAPALRDADLRVWQIKVAVLMLLMLAAGRLIPVSAGLSDRLSRLAFIVVSVLLLVTLAVGLQAYADPANRQFGMIDLWVCATVVFATGLQLPLACLSIALLALPLVLLVCWLLGLSAGLGVYAVHLSVAGVFLVGFSFVMTMLQRQVFLQGSLLLRDKERLTALSEQLAQLSLKDGLTGVANRRRFDEVLQREWSRSQRQGSFLALLFVDVDNFKAYNDHYGHQAGDDCLRALAFVLVDAGRRPGDLVARYGGEEFVLLLPDTDITGAMEAANRIRSFLAQAALPHAAAPSGRVTVSVGVSALLPGAGESSDLVAAADRALYRAKAAGRNRIEVELLSA